MADTFKPVTLYESCPLNFIILKIEMSVAHAKDCSTMPLYYRFFFFFIIQFMVLSYPNISIITLGLQYIRITDILLCITSAMLVHNASELT